MDYCFDTSAINRLHDDPDQIAVVSGLNATNQVFVTALSIREAVATREFIVCPAFPPPLAPPFTLVYVVK
jgi:hypothetical protein